MGEEGPFASLSGLSEHESALWRELIRERCGLYFSDSRLRYLVQSLKARMRQCQLDSFQDYYQYLMSESSGIIEWQSLVDLLLNNETDFFRHKPSFSALTEYALPQLIDKGTHLSPITIWSAGCSTGHEAYSLAITFLEFASSWNYGGLKRPTADSTRALEVKVRGSDISRKALRQARSGQYKSHEIRSLPDHYRERYFTTSGDGHQLLYQVMPHVKQIVDFGYVNLHDPGSSPFAPLPYIGGRGEGVDIIFCQNVLIYFTHEDRLKIVEQLCKRLRPDGCLFLGPAEAMGMSVSGMKSVRLDDVLIYQRTV